jgi:hypothetical protein
MLIMYKEYIRRDLANLIYGSSILPESICTPMV